MISYSKLLNDGRNILKSKNIDSYVLDARILLEHAANISHEQLIFLYENDISEDILQNYQNFINQRASYKPISQIIGYKEFYGRDFKINNNVLTPRPETELIIDIAKEYFPSNENIKILDLGTGSGCIIITLLLEFENSTGYAIDLSLQALDIAKYNAHKFNVNNRLSIQEGNWFNNLNEYDFDLIVSNPPYIKNNDVYILDKDVSIHEPHLALFGGEYGLSPYEIIIPQLKIYLAKYGYAIFEFGQNQHDQISDIARDAGLNIVDIREDLSKIKRSIILSH